MKSIYYVENFYKDRKHLIKKYPTTWGNVKIVDLDGLPGLELQSPQLLAGFSSYLKYHCKGKVYFRGEKCFYNSTIPSLFRGINREPTNEIITKKRAFDELIDSLPSLYNTSKRFKKDDFRPLLQHYGIKTDWIDVVDNIFVALWFSNNRSREPFSFVKFFVDINLVVQDLRESNSSLSLRPHCQHGFSVTKDTEWDVGNIDFNDNLIAIAKLPNVPKMQLGGYIFSDEFMFPNEELDNTFKLLKKAKFQANIDKIVLKYGLDKNALGKVC